jgi:hypothetical protein
VCPIKLDRDGALRFTAGHFTHSTAAHPWQFFCLLSCESVCSVVNGFQEFSTTEGMELHGKERRQKGKNGRRSFRLIFTGRHSAFST